jgi:hypothetical protein
VEVVPDHDDWFALSWGDIEHVLKYFRVSPPLMSIGVVRSLVDDLAALAKDTDDEPALYAIEQVVDKHQVPGLTLWTLFAMQKVCAEAPDTYDPDARGVFDRIPVAELGRILGRHIGRIEPNDIVELAEIAHELGDDVNVLAGLVPSTLTSRLSPRSLRVLTVKDLRTVLESLTIIARSGVRR